jgi:hypothetical protein
MLHFLLFILGVTLFSCATPQQYNDEANCSPRTLDHLKSIPKKSIFPEKEKKFQEQGEEFKNIVLGDVKKCLQSNFDNLGREEYKVCAVVATDKNGKLNFFDIEDNSNNLSIEIHNCINIAIGERDFTNFPKMSIAEPIIVNLKKK